MIKDDNTVERIQLTCLGCGEQISTLYLETGVCQNCYGTDDDPWMDER